MWHKDPLQIVLLVTAGTAQTLESPKSFGHSFLDSKRCWTGDGRSIPKTVIRPTCLTRPLESFTDVLVWRRASRKVERSQKGPAVWKRGFHWAVTLVERLHQLSHSSQSLPRLKRLQEECSCLHCHFTSSQHDWILHDWCPCAFHLSRRGKMSDARVSVHVCNCYLSKQLFLFP